MQKIAECDKEIFEISMRKETPLNSISDYSIRMLSNAENDYSDWCRETPIDVLSITTTAGI